MLSKKVDEISRFIDERLDGTHMDLEDILQNNEKWVAEMNIRNPGVFLRCCFVIQHL